MASFENKRLSAKEAFLKIFSISSFILLERATQRRELENEAGREADEVVLRDEVLQGERRESQLHPLQLGRVEPHHFDRRRPDCHL